MASLRRAVSGVVAPRQKRGIKGLDSHRAIKEEKDAPEQEEASW